MNITRKANVMYNSDSIRSSGYIHKFHDHGRG
jgi:hypothetical protein